MVRPQRIRRIFFKPDITYFKPAGVLMKDLKEVILSFDELEAIRLVDSEGMEQTKAGRKMKVSQSTLSRLLKTGRRKLVNAIIQGQALKIQGGNFKMTPSKGRGLGMGIGRGFGGRGRIGDRGGTGRVCKCPKCGYEEPKIRGQPCMDKKCPKCGIFMTRR